MTAANRYADAPAALYRGEVMHARMKPKTHRFAYSVYTLLIDIDALGEADSLSRLFSVGRFNCFRSAPRTTGTAGVRRSASTSDGCSRKVRTRRAVERAVLLCYPRVLGFVFNPISVYFAFGAGGGWSA